MPLSIFIAIALLVATLRLPAQVTTNSTLAASVPEAPATLNGTDEKVWSFSVSASTYLVPDSQDYVQPTFTATRDWLHLEARYNYEALETGSAWIGYHVGVGEKIAIEIAPMLGGVFGETTGIAPGYKASVSWWKLELSSEGEYVFDTADSSDNFFYTWSELSLAPTDWLRFGVAVQRTKVFETEFDIQRGFLVGLSYKWLEVTAYVFNPDADPPTWVLALSLGF